MDVSVMLLLTHRLNRLRMPISDDLSDRNFVTKIARYYRVVDVIRVADVVNTHFTWWRTIIIFRHVGWNKAIYIDLGTQLHVSSDRFASFVIGHEWEAFLRYISYETLQFLFLHHLHTMWTNQQVLLVGIYNFCNPGAISHNQVLQIYRVWK